MKQERHHISFEQTPQEFLSESDCSSIISRGQLENPGKG